jgi:putative ABC transport system permease protein
MLGNYLAAAVRNLLRDRAYTLINLFGLSLGFVAAILIALYVRDEYSYDQFFPEHARTYRLTEIVEVPGRGPLPLTVSSSVDARAMKLTFPEIEEATRLQGTSARLFRAGDSTGAAPLAAYWADPNFFQLFPMRVIDGTLAGALSRPDGVVLTRTFARTLFGRENVAGEPVRVGRDTNMRVTAVVEDLPSNTHLNIDVVLPGIASTSALTQEDAQQARPGALRAENVHTYIRLRPGADIEKVRARLRAFADSHVPGEINGMRIAQAYTFYLTPITEIHLQPRGTGDMKPPSDPRIVHAMIGIAVLILVVACGNFVSMMTARAARRAVEVGVRKTVGATRRQIMIQFMGECLFYAVLALIPALIAVELLLPSFNGFLQRTIAFDYGRDPELALGLLALVLVTGLAAGAYPALYLSRFQPTAVLKGTSLLPNSSRVRQALVVFQFATLIGLLVATFTVNSQMRYAIQERLHLPTSQIYIGSGAGNCQAAFAESVRGLEGVRAASCAGGSALTFGHYTAILSPPPGGETVAARAAPVDFAFFDLFGIKPVAGRLLSADYGQDGVLLSDPAASENPTLVINESAARNLGFASPADAVGKFWPWQRVGMVDGQPKLMEKSSSEIVGVVPDFSIGSVRDAVSPVAYYVDPAAMKYLVLKLDGGMIQKGLESVQSLYTKQQPNSRFDGTFLDQYMNQLYLDITTQSQIFTVFASVAMVLAALGLLGLAIFTAERRTKEIGLRKVMGARRADILVFLGWQFTRPVLWANLVAWPCAWLLLRRWLQGFVYHIDLDPMMFVGAGVLALFIALATVASHALLVARAKPVEALRYE